MSGPPKLKSGVQLGESHEAAVFPTDAGMKSRSLYPSAGGGFVSMIVSPPVKPPYSELSGKRNGMDCMMSTGMGIEKLPETGSTFPLSQPRASPGSRLALERQLARGSPNDTWIKDKASVNF